jgi:serine/threonine-protein kinase
METIAQLNTSLAGRYVVEREIGAGGMATVFLARDLRHDRRVALKLLKAELGAILGVERFLSEIRVTANLQHPNLLPLFDSGEAGGLLFYVMPYVEGESLRARLTREKQLPVEEAVRIAVAVATALDYAHREGVIHRDLKPENILLQAGQPVISDFGIALAVSKAGGARITQTGLSLGTPQYMSPEQATGDRVIDGRTDIYSLGAVLYEMLVGDPPHLGGTAQAIIAKVLTERPRSVRLSRPGVPVQVEAAVERALEKLPADRFANAQEFADALTGKLVATLGAGGARAAAAAIAAPAWSPRRFAALLVREAAFAGLVLVGLGFGLAQLLHTRKADESPLLRLQLMLPKDHSINDALPGTPIAISPRGDRIAYMALTPTSGGSLLWVRPADQVESRQLIASGAAARSPRFSPDGGWIAFTEGNDIKKVSVDGGPVVTLATLPEQPAGLAWGTSGFLVSGTFAAGLFIIPEQGGPARQLPKLADEGANRWPLVTRDGKKVVYASLRSGGSYQLAVTTVADGRRTMLGVPGSSPLAILNGQLVYATTAGVLMAVPFDGNRVTTTSAVPLVQDVVMDANGAAHASVSSTGTLVYRSGKAEYQPVLVHGGTTPLVTELRNNSNPRFSPDGKRVAFTVTSTQAMDVWVYDRGRSTLTKVTSEGNNQRPEWSPDGKRLLFVSDRSGATAFWWQPADGSGKAELLYKPAEGDPFEGLISPDGKWLVYRTGPAGKPQRAIFAVQLDGDRKTSELVATKAFNQMPRVSPDGHWLAYMSNETGPYEIYVRPFPGAGGRVQVSSGLGTEPLWAKSGRTLYYRRGRDIVGVSVAPGASFGIGERKVVLSGDYLSNPSHQNWDVSPDGSEFLMIRQAGEEVHTMVVSNWVKELAAKTGGRR